MTAKPIRRRLMNLEDKGMASKFGQNQLIMKANSFAIACCLGILLSGCTYSTTSHSFKFYGSTQESFGRDFFYVQYGVTGAATAAYTSRGGGHVRDGLIADAKRNLIKAHPLGPNQSYVNMSIDVSKTELGSIVQEDRVVARVELTATISADVIQFGQPPLDYEIPLAGSSSLVVSGKSLSQPSEEVRVDRPEKQIEPAQKNEVEQGASQMQVAEQKKEESEPKVVIAPAKIDYYSEVVCQFKGDWFSGVVVGKNLTGTQFQVKFDRYGKTITKWLGTSAVRLKE